MKIRIQNMEKTIRRKVNTVMKWEGTPLVILHGLMGGLSNFDAASYFSDKGYKIVFRIYLYTLKIF
jgi:hypothetical protein